MLNTIWENKKVRFLCVGVFNTTVDLSILNLLVFAFNFPVWLANTFSISIAVSISYFLNHHIVFRHHNKRSAKMFVKFFLITGIGIIVIQTVVIELTRAFYLHLVQRHVPSLNSNVDTKLSLNMAKVTGVIVGMVWNYVLYSKLVFKKPIHTEEAL